MKSSHVALARPVAIEVTRQKAVRPTTSARVIRAHRPAVTMGLRSGVAQARSAQSSTRAVPAFEGAFQRSVVSDDVSTPAERGEMSRGAAETSAGSGR